MVTIASTEEALTEVADGIRVAHLGTNESQSVQYAEVEPGVSTEPHSHEEQQVALIVQGEAAFTIEGDRHHVSAGDVIVYESGEAHGSEILGDEVFKSIDVFTPPRVPDELPDV